VAMLHKLARFRLTDHVSFTVGGGGVFCGPKVEWRLLRGVRPNGVPVGPYIYEKMVWLDLLGPHEPNFTNSFHR
jgi:hypothetical protein